jgi:hypothetical protein
MSLEIHVWGRQTKSGGVKPVNGIPTLSLSITGSPSAIHINTNDKNPAHNK